jgi:hypothetical protein
MANISPYHRTAILPALNSSGLAVQVIESSIIGDIVYFLFSGDKGSENSFWLFVLVVCFSEPEARSTLTRPCLEDEKDGLLEKMHYLCGQNKRSLWQRAILSTM